MTTPSCLGWPRLRLALLAAPLALAACADGDLYNPAELPPNSPLPPLAEGPELTVELDRNTTDAIPFVEEVAARCWLDGVVQADAMIVDRRSGRIVLTGETDDLLVADFLPATADDALAQLRLSGPVVANEDKTEAMLEFLTRAQRTGQIDCPAPGGAGGNTPVIADG
ncbi:MAG: hypothetical protein AAFQ88_12540 [Pseudomonadota bacterium]